MNRISPKDYERLEELQGYAEELAQLLEGLTETARECHDGRSERWQESEAGQDYGEWLATFEEASDEARRCADSAMVERSPIP